jgi:hypothetical protein
MVHTGAKTQLGGEKLGFAIVGYQVLTEDCVTILADNSAKMQIKIQIIYDFCFFKKSFNKKIIVHPFVTNVFCLILIVINQTII